MLQFCTNRLKIGQNCTQCHWYHYKIISEIPYPTFLHSIDLLSFKCKAKETVTY